MALSCRFAAATSLAAAFSLAAMPALAHGHYHHRHHDHVDAGDVIAGVAILGGIAAIASAASHADHHDYPAVPPPPPVPDDRQGYAYDAPSRDMGLDRAASQCAAAVERGRSQVDYIDNVARDSDGWSVTGVLVGGEPFNCRLGNDGRVNGVDVGRPRAPGDSVPYEGENGAGSLGAESDDDGAPAVDNRPVWHDPATNAAPPADGRYETSDAPDFGESV